MESCDSQTGCVHFLASEYFSRTGDHHPYIHGILTCANETVILQAFLLHVHCFTVTVRRRLLMFHENYSVSYYKKVLTKFYFNRIY